MALKWWWWWWFLSGSAHKHWLICTVAIKRLLLLCSADSFCWVNGWLFWDFWLWICYIQCCWFLLCVRLLSISSEDEIVTCLSVKKKRTRFVFNFLVYITFCNLDFYSVLLVMQICDYFQYLTHNISHFFLDCIIVLLYSLFSSSAPQVCNTHMHNYLTAFCPGLPG